MGQTPSDEPLSLQYTFQHSLVQKYTNNCGLELDSLTRLMLLSHLVEVEDYNQQLIIKYIKI